MATQEIQCRRDKLEEPLVLRGLTPRQADILRYILQCWLSGFLPTIREIADEHGIRSPNGVVCHLRALRMRGYLEDVGEKSGLVLTDKSLELAM